MPADPIAESELAIREAATTIIALTKRFPKDDPRLYEALREPMAKLLERPNLLELGVKREGNHIDNSKYLYYDGQLILTLDNFPKGKRIPPHDHGVWEALCIYRGAVSLHGRHQARLHQLAVDEDGARAAFAGAAAFLRAREVELVAQEVEEPRAGLRDLLLLATVDGQFQDLLRHGSPPSGWV